MEIKGMTALLDNGEKMTSEYKLFKCLIENP